MEGVEYGGVGAEEWDQGGGGSWGRRVVGVGGHTVLLTPGPYDPNDTVSDLPD